MISDTLHDAVFEIKRYLADPVFTDCYTGETRERIRKLVAEMDAVRRELD